MPGRGFARSAPLQRPTQIRVEPFFLSSIPRPPYAFADLRIVDRTGSIRCGDHKYFASSSLVGDTIGIFVLNQRYAEVRLGPLPLGLFDTELPLLGLIRPKPPRKHRVSSMSPV